MVHMIGYLLVVPVVLVAGYFIARYHHRFRDIGIGTAFGAAAGSAVPSLPSVSDVHGHADGRHPGISDGGDAHGISDWGSHHDSASWGSDHDATSAHGHSDF